MELPPNYHAGPSDFLAVERTFLAWIRTGLALMALGFVLARFGLFLKEFTVVRPGAQDISYGYSLWFGTGLILLGVLVCVLSLIRYLRLVGQLRSGSRSFDNTSALAVGVAILLGVLGLAMSYYLVATRHVSAPDSPKVKEGSMSAVPEAILENGIVRIASAHSVAETVAKLETILQAKNVKLFAVVDHSGEAEKAGLSMPNTKLLIFGNPKAGTPLMLASPSVALDFPLKILVAEDAAGKTWVSYNAPEYLQKRHNLPTNLLPNIAVIDELASNAAQ
ncbi:MAG TPA: DUF302 domain-containing protein [Candidatus Sulfotelmatobacter sp.]|nr:DUF302 domain-containing protein [Candidatus Sulfotelmatobacter sp.]